MKLYSFKIYDNGTLVRDFIPVKDSKGIGCLYDKVYNKPYYNKGLGTFKLGAATGAAAITKSSPRKVTKGYVGVDYGYTLLENLKCNGAQYIDTGFKANNNTKVEFKVKFADATQVCLYCCRDIDSGGATASNTFTTFKIANNKWRVDYNKIGTEFAGTTDTSTIYTYVQDKTKFYQNGTLLNTSSAATFQAEHPMLLFASDAASFNHTLSNWANYYFYECKIYDNGTLVRHFLPVKLSNGTICLLDTIHNNFYFNQGSGTFTAGTEIKNIQQIEYLQSSGTQYIDTRFKPTPNTRVQMSFDLLARRLQDRFFGTEDSGGLVYQTYINGAYAFAYAYQNYTGNWITTRSSVVVGNRVLIDFDGKNKTYTITNGNATPVVLPLSDHPATMNCSHNLYLFGNNFYESLASTNTRCCTIKMYYCKIYDNNILVRDYVPALLNGSFYGLYDKVTQQFYFNRGTNNFSGGATTKTTYTLQAFAQTASAHKQFFDKYNYIDFSASIAPTSWSSTDVASPRCHFYATNSYGQWYFTASGAYSSSFLPDKAVDNNTSSYWNLNAINDDTTKWSGTLTPPVAILPKTFYFRRSYCGATTVMGKIKGKQTVQNLTTYNKVSSTVTENTNTINTKYYYDQFVLSGVRYSSTRVRIHEIKIPTGTIRKEK